MIKQGQLLVTFNSYVDRPAKSSIHTQFNGKKIDEIPQLHVEVIEVPVGEEEKYKKLYEQHPEVRFVEYNVIWKLNYQPYMRVKCRHRLCGCLPNDPYYLEKIETSKDGLQDQWGLQRINPEQAFCKVKNSRPITKIAILDSGIDPNHPDLKEKIMDPINFTSDDPEDYIDILGHGTSVAGIAAAVTNNQTGIASASYNTAYIVPVKVFAGGPKSITTTILKGIMYAIEQKVDVMNMSFGSGAYSQNTQEALEMAWDQGIISIAARGNDGSEQIDYPNCYNYVLSVSATNKLDRLASFSSWGTDVGITAPGVAILSTTPTYPLLGYQLNYDAADGTSFSTPFVSGVAAILRVIKPSASNQEIIQVIQRSARSLDTKDKKWDPFYGYGLLNLSAAVQEIKRPQIPYGEYCNLLGSFYGQVVDSEGNPMGGILIIAVDNRTGESIRLYQTKCTICQMGEEVSRQSDGMFRLFNLPGGNYSIYVRAVIPELRLIESVDVVLGADVYVKLVFPGEEENTTSGLERNKGNF
ncbi:S8 family serine peptidase [Bacillus toyonensis]|uniref:S8 family serine peptidase n=1 Tax=Bacillus toyonensis TaxID=155322 RepID=UPI0015CF2A46|nr:S8 family serine peptidase [Bacillus toyonensis]